MYLRVRCLPLSTSLIFDFGIVPKVWFFFFIHDNLHTDSSLIVIAFCVVQSFWGSCLHWIFHSFTYCKVYRWYDLMLFETHIWIGGRRGSDRMVAGFITTCAISVCHHYGCEFESCSGEVYSIQHYVITFVSDMRKIGGFFLVLWFPPPIKLTTTILLK